MKLEEHLADCDEDLKQLIIRLGEICKTISRGFATRQEFSDTENIYGERQMAMDKWADELIIEIGRASCRERV